MAFPRHITMHRGKLVFDKRHTWPDGRRERIRFRVPDDMQTQRKLASFQRNVLALLDRGVDPRKEEPSQPEPERQESPTFAKFSELFIKTYAKTNNRASTAREKRRALKRGLVQELGDLRLDQIGAREIEAFKARRKADGVANKTINEELSILSKILDYATEIGDLTTLPPKIRRLKVQPPSFDFFDFDEAERLIDAARRSADPWCAMIPFAVLTGLRLGELRGLQWDDVDLRAARMHVQRAADDKGELTPTKSYRGRVLDLAQRAVAILREHRHLRGPFVFCLEDGSMLHNHHCESKSRRERDDSPLMKVCREAGLRRMGWHGLRHTYASHLIMLGASLNEVKELLGHSSIQMTMRYAHLSPRARQSAVALLDGPRPTKDGYDLGTADGGRSKTDR